MIDGVAVVDKPAGWTSHDVVARCRRIFGQKRVGHSGTLDPDATGVLLLGLGRATRLMRFLTELPKSYVGEVVLGVATSTLDSSGEVTATWDMSQVSDGEVRAAAARFVGEIEQVPPMVSAVKVGGRRLHELARAGQEVDRAARRVVVHRFEVGDRMEAAAGAHGPVYPIAVTCSSGTYVRTLAADLGEALGGGAHLRALRRTAIGSFTEGDAVALEALGPGDVLPPVEALRDHPRVVVGADVATAVRHGKVLDQGVLPPPELDPRPVAVVDDHGQLLAVYERTAGNRMKPAVVVAAG